MVDVVVREDSEHGPEDLLPDGGGVRGQISKDGGLDLPTPVEVLRTSAARNDAGAFGAAGCDEAFHALALLLRDQRSDARGRVERVARSDRARSATASTTSSYRVRGARMRLLR